MKVQINEFPRSRKISKGLLALALSSFLQIASAGTELISPAIDGSLFLNGTPFAAPITPDVTSKEIYAGVYRLGVLNAENNWKLPYTCSTLGLRKIDLPKMGSGRCILMQPEDDSGNLKDGISRELVGSFFWNGTWYGFNHLPRHN